MVEGERRRAIAKAYAELPHAGPQTETCINFVRRICRCRSISHFLDTAKGSNVAKLERMLNP
jgi:hypothetical protein